MQKRIVSHCKVDNTPMIVMMAGLPGTGKSTLSRILAQRLSGAVLDKDIIRAALFPPTHIEYSRTQDDFCQEIMLQTATYLLEKHSSLFVFLDGRTFSLRYQRQRVQETRNPESATPTTWDVCTECAAGRVGCSSPRVSILCRLLVLWSLPKPFNAQDTDRMVSARGGSRKS